MAIPLPVSFLHSIKELKGFDEPAFVKLHASGEQVTSIRLNPGKFSIEQCSLPVADKIPWTGNGYYLEERPSFTVDPCFHAGAYYVQEASSMFLEEAIRQSCDLGGAMHVLDSCAAPGGKSTLIQSLLSADSLLISNEVIKTRANILAENITRWGAANVVVTNNDPKDFARLPGFFDLVVVDAPCSGSGLFRKDPQAIGEWSMGNVQLCSQRQQRILAAILPSLKPGGVLIYSTCSYSELEDECIADWLLQEQALQPVQLTLPAEWNIIETRSAQQGAWGYRFYPDKLRGEGFFIAVFKKPGAPGYQSKEFKSKNKPALLSKAETAIVESYILNPGFYTFIKWQEDIIAIPSGIYDDFLLVQSQLYLKKAGVKIGSIIRDELIPDHELALSKMLSPGFPAVSLDRENALQYLRRQEMDIRPAIKGWALVKYKELSLGFIKILPNRINNYYPKEWRILNK